MALFSPDQLARIEGYLANGQTSEVLPALQNLTADMQVYIDEHCVPSDEVQYFSFATPFEKLAYRRVERDPRTLVDAPAAFDRAWADYAWCLMGENDLEGAAAAFKQAVRWNPMDCELRLELARTLLNLGDLDESLKLSHSVFARASKASHLVRAYLNFADYFEQAEELELAAACTKCALRLNPADARVKACATRLVANHQVDAGALADEDVERLLEPQGIPVGANVEVVLVALTLADIAGEQGDLETCRDMALVAVDLVGQQQANALAQLIREQNNS